MPGRLLTTDAEIGALVKGLRRIAVLGIKTEAQAGQPAFDVPRYLQSQGIAVVPVPVYYPEATEILGERVFRSVSAIPGEIDCVDVFRKPGDLMPHLDDLIAKRPKSVWLQLSIRNDDFAGKLLAAGIDVVQDRCLLVDHRRHARAEAATHQLVT
jgi:predicted CoA-binding protein